MKLYLQILELNLRHKFKDTFITFWNNQNDEIFKLNKDKPSCTVEFNIDYKKPFGMMLGAYGIRHVDNEKIYHPCGNVLIDISKIKLEKPTTIVTNLFDSTFVKPNMGKLRLLITWKSNNIPKTIPSMKQIGHKMFLCSEKNLNYIAPWGHQGVPPIEEHLVKLHSPYYTCNIGVTMPAGGFLLNLGKKEQSNKVIKSSLQRLQTTLQLYGLKEKNFIKYADKIEDGESDLELNNALFILAKTLTMHSNQVQKYVADIQYDGKNEQNTDRWESPRNIESNYVGDCEDTAKEIMIEIYEWQNIKSNNKLILAVQKLLKKYVPMALQGAVNQNGTLKNHIWAALIPENTFHFALNKKQTKKSKYELPTILLEGTAETIPFKYSSSIIKNYIETTQKIVTEEPVLTNAIFCDYKPSDWYKYVVGAMSPIMKHKGIIDYVFITRNKYGESKYGITFDKWLSGKYIMTPATRHSQQDIKTMEMLCKYDKPILPLKYNTSIVHSINKPIYHMSEKQIKFGYKMFSTTDSKHVAICEAIERLRKKKWNIFGNVINHEKSFWVEWVIEQDNEKVIDFFLL